MGSPDKKSEGEEKEEEEEEGEEGEEEERKRKSELEEFRRAFDDFDANKDGTITTSELHAALRLVCTMHCALCTMQYALCTFQTLSGKSLY